MATTLSVEAIEQSTYVITVNFYDEDSLAVVPNEASWTLTDEAGNVINSREDVAIEALAASVDVVLSGDDLAVAGATEAGRIFTVAGTYDSSLGSDLPFRDHVRFVVEGLTD